jgi:beta-N-acetylhexosaminidase
MMTTDLDRLALAVQLAAFPGPVLADDAAVLVSQGLGGICLFGSNTAAGPGALAQLVGTARAVRADLVVAVDEEGGDVTRLHAVAGSPALGAATLGAIDDPALTRDVAAGIGAELAAAGIGLALGPVADVNTDPRNPVIGTRSFGSDPATAARHVAAWVTGLQSAGVAGCAKHFPGHGHTHEDSHLGLPVVEADDATLRRRELPPFAAAVEAGVAAVMTSHLVVPTLDGEPATFSRPVVDLLRGELGFRGAVVTDALDMAGASADRGIPAAAVAALAAGCDLLCLGPDKDPALVRAVQQAIVGAVRHGGLTEERLVEAAGRVAALRRPAGPGGTGPASPDDLAQRQRRAARRALVVDGDLPSLAGALVVLAGSPPTIAVGDVPWGLPTPHAVDPADPDAVPTIAALRDRGPVVLQVRDAHRRPEVGRLVDLLGPGDLVVELGWPGPWAGATPRVSGYGASLPVVAAVADLLRSRGWQS